MSELGDKLRKLRQQAIDNGTPIGQATPTIEELEAENEKLRQTILAVKQDCKDRINWILAELRVPMSDWQQIIEDAIVATTNEMP